MSTQQASLFQTPAIIPVCTNCHQPKSKVLAERAAIVARFHQPISTCPCCDPLSESRCPRCNSTELEFAMHYPNAWVSDECCEMARCTECGWTGEAEEAAPAPIWAELEAVAEQVTERMPMAVEEDEMEMARRLGAPLGKVA